MINKKNAVLHLNSVIEDITKQVAECSKIPIENVKSSLSVYRDGVSDFVMFFNQISQNPAEEAKRVCEILKEKNLPEITNISVKDTHVNFDLNKKLFFERALKTVHSKNTEFGKNTIGQGKNVIVEYSSPNIAKLFHVGHYRTTILGNFIANLMRNSGFKVTSMNYLGDWGKQFGLVLLGFEKYGNEDKLKSNALMHLFDVYVKIYDDAKKDAHVHENARNIFRDMEEYKNEKYLSVWRRFRELSINKYQDLYKRLNIEFDVYSGESFYQDLGLEFAKTTSIAKTEKDGSKIIECGALGNALIQKADGTTLYLTRDICAAKDRVEKYNPHKIIYVVDSAQNQHLSQLFCCMEKLGYDKSIFEHVNFGRVNGMSTRNGNVHFLEDIIDQSAKAVKKRLLNNQKIEENEMESIAHILAISTLLVADFGAKRIKNYTFDADQRANCEKGSGAYLQYAHCRLNSIEVVNSDIDMCDISDVSFSLIDEPEVHDLCYKLMWFEKLLEQCLEDYEPSRIVLFLMDLAKTANFLISKYRVKGEDSAVAKARLLVFNCTRIVIRNGLEVLGMVPLNKM